MTGIKDCCKQESNLADGNTGREDLAMRVCQVCGCRHFELTVDPATYFAEAKEVS